MVEIVSQVLGSSASSSFVQYTSSIITILGFVFALKLLAKVFDI